MEWHSLKESLPGVCTEIMKLYYKQFQSSKNSGEKDKIKVKMSDVDGYTWTKNLFGHILLFLFIRK